MPLIYYNVKVYKDATRRHGVSVIGPIAVDSELHRQFSHENTSQFYLVITY